MVMNLEGKCMVVIPLAKKRRRKKANEFSQGMYAHHLICYTWFWPGQSQCQTHTVFDATYEYEYPYAHPSLPCEL